MKKFAVNTLMVVGIFAAGILGADQFFKARDNAFGLKLADNIQTAYTQEKQMMRISQQDAYRLNSIMNDGKISSDKDYQKYHGNKSYFDFLTENETKLRKGIINFENQQGEDRYFNLADNVSPKQIREWEKTIENKRFEKILLKNDFSNINQVREFRAFSVDFAQALRVFANNNKKRFKDGTSLDIVGSQLSFDDFKDVLDIMYQKSVKVVPKNQVQYQKGFSRYIETNTENVLWLLNELV